MDWEPTHNLKRKAEWYYSIDPKQRRLNPSQEREEHEKKIGLYLNTNMDSYLKLIDLIHWGEFDLFKRVLNSLIESIKDRSNLYRPSLYRAALDSDDRRFYDELVAKSVTSNMDFLNAALSPPDLNLFKKLEQYGRLPIKDVVLISVSKNCKGSKILNHILYSYYHTDETLLKALDIVAQLGCVDNFNVLFRFMASNGYITRSMMPGLKNTIRIYNNDEMMLEIRAYEKFITQNE